MSLLLHAQEWSDFILLCLPVWPPVFRGCPIVSSTKQPWLSWGSWAQITSLGWAQITSLVWACRCCGHNGCSPGGGPCDWPPAWLACRIEGGQCRQNTSGNPELGFHWHWHRADLSVTSLMWMIMVAQAECRSCEAYLEYILRSFLGEIRL